MSHQSSLAHLDKGKIASTRVRMRAWRTTLIVVALISALSLSTASALPNPDDTPGNPAPPPNCLAQTKVSFSSLATSLQLGDSTTLSWSVQLGKSGPPGLEQLYLGGDAVPFVGSRAIQPMATTSYSLFLTIDQTSTKVAGLRVTVNLPNPVDIKGTTQPWKSLMIQALGEPGKTVRLAPNLDLDLTNYSGIRIARGVTFVGGLPCPTGTKPSSTPLGSLILCGAHDAQTPGPRIFTNSKPKPLFVIACADALGGDGVRISGFRLQGPHWDTAEGDDNLENGIYIESCVDVEIANMELSGWSFTPISITDEIQNRISSPQEIRIHDNFIHHNQHQGGYGYGIDIAHGAYALIERNVFDFNRHAITASGRPDTGYSAFQNLILKGGGRHDRWYNEYTHQFDVHGDRDCLGSPYACGNAGESIWMIDNAFQYVHDNAIKIRGTPSYGAFIFGNVFAHDSLLGAAVIYNGVIPERLHLAEAGQPDNILGVDSYGQYGVCDFDGDGKDDLFLGTGVSWWYMSSAKRQWVYLNGFPERVHQVGLGDFDGDHRCDVFAVHGNDWVISSGGTGPWRSLGSFGVPFDQLRFGDFNGDGITDIFRRAPDGQWYAISPGFYGWTVLQSSSRPLSELRFGDFNNDRVTDVIAVEAGHWSVSWGGRTTWEPLNASLSDSLGSVLITDLDGNGRDDIIRFTPVTDTVGSWQVSWDGRGVWQPLTQAPMSWSSDYADELPARRVRAYVGHFGDTPGGDLLALDFTRYSQIFDKVARTFVPYSQYAY